jgi:hypothetical protein
MRAERPYRVEQFAVAASRLATCAENALALAYSGGRGLLSNTYSFSRLDDGETIHVVAKTGDINMWDLAFVSTGPFTTRVEVRPSRNIVGDPNYPSDMWQTIENACGR